MKTNKRLHPAVAAIFALLAALTLVPPALAGEYAVDACSRPDGSYVKADGWSPRIIGAYSSVEDRCANGGGFAATFTSANEHNFGDYAYWYFSAPSGTRIRSINGSRTARASADRPFGTPGTVIRSDGRFAEQCNTAASCDSLNGTFSYQLEDAEQVYFGVVCGGAPGGRCPAGATSLEVNRVRLSLFDGSSPVFSETPSGSLTSSTELGRIRSLSYSATDQGSGVYQQKLVVDGTERQVSVVDVNDGRCVRHATTAGFAHAVPCRNAVSGNIAFDTSQLSDGAHTVALQLSDATTTNIATRGPWTVVVDNQAPSVGDVAVSGRAEQGQTLACAATVQGQAAATAYQWLRTNADGSGAVPLAGAVGSTYTLTAEDVGRKVLCRVTGTDNGGSTVRTSELAGGPFADGATVAPQPAALPATTGTVAANGGTGGTGGSGGTGAPGSSGGDGGNGGAGSNGGTTASASAGATAAALAATAAVGPCTTASVKTFGTVTKLSRSYDRSAIPLSGRLLATNGEPQPGRLMQLVQTVVRTGATTRTKVGSVRTKPDGTFRVTAPPGPSRALQVVLEGCGSVGPVLTERVRGLVSAKTTTRRVRNGQTARITGRALGGYTGKGIPLELQVKVGRQWRDVKHAMTNSRGEYKVAYQFKRTYVRYTYRFRVVSRAGGAWPYMPATSKVVKIGVN